MCFSSLFLISTPAKLLFLRLHFQFNIFRPFVYSGPKICTPAVLWKSELKRASLSLPDFRFTVKIWQDLFLMTQQFLIYEAIKWDSSQCQSIWLQLELWYLSPSTLISQWKWDISIFNVLFNNIKYQNASKYLDILYSFIPRAERKERIVTKFH